MSARSANALAAAALALTGLLAACSGGVTGPDRSTPSASSVPPSPVATDKPGGTLRIVGQTMPSGDPGWADDSASRSLLRMVSRQLYSYPSTDDPAAATTPVPDLAAGAPVVTDGDRTWTVKVRPAARWDVPGGRRVTATDVARGIKRLCTPPDQAPERGYFAATVVGFTAYCARVARTPASRVPDLIESTDIPGVQVIGDDTVTFHLLAPASDFTDVLALPGASPVPLEELAYPPNSAEYLSHLISDGPYHFTGPPTGNVYRLSRNSSWTASSDTIRAAFADHVTITTGMSADAVQSALDHGQADMELDTAVPSGDVADLVRDPAGRLVLDGPTTLTALVVGLHGPASKALRNTYVRRALPYCVDRSTVADSLGGANVAEPTGQLLGPTMLGYVPTDPFPSFGDAGDPAQCRARLAAAGSARPAALVLLAPATPTATQVAATLVASFARAGVTLTVTTVAPAAFARAAVSPTKQSWDLALTTVTPDWYGAAGRTVFQPLLDGDWKGPRPADGGFRSVAVTTMLAAALAQRDTTKAQAAWAALDDRIASDVAVVPLVRTVTPRFHGTNVRGFVVVPSLGDGDPTNVSLSVT
ncbi:MAG: ABC transporter substrate-binding protein [Frankia sp.]